MAELGPVAEFPAATVNGAAVPWCQDGADGGPAFGGPAGADVAADGGFTDIELRSSDAHVIVEAKRGWGLPSLGQLRRYEASSA